MGSPAKTARWLRANRGTTDAMSHWLASSMTTRSNKPGTNGTALRAERLDTDHS
jgi:hypothetical protein